MLRMALLYLVLCIIAIRRALASFERLPRRFNSLLEKKVPDLGRQEYISFWCPSRCRPREENRDACFLTCIDEEVQNKDEPLSYTQLNWVLERAGKSLGLEVIKTCRDRKRCQLNMKNKSSADEYHLCISNCILEEVYTVLVPID